MRRVTSFCVLVASMLILIQGARSEHAFRQNDRPPNAVERDADKYNRPQVSAKLPINPQDQDDLCPIKTDAWVESAKTTEKVADLTRVPVSRNRQDVGQSSTRIQRRRDTRQVVRQSTARLNRRKDTGSRDIVRQSTARRYRRRDTGTIDVVRQSTNRRHNRRDTGTRYVVRQNTVKEHRRRDTGNRDVVRRITTMRQRRTDTGTRYVRQFTARRHRQSDHEFRRVTAASSQGRSTRRSRLEVNRRRNRNTSKRHQVTGALHQAVSDLESSPRVPVVERELETDVRRRIRHNTKRARKSIRRDELGRISVPLDSYTDSVIGLFTMQTSKRRQRHDYPRSNRRVVRRVRQTRVYKRISSSIGLEGINNNKDDSLSGRIDDIENGGLEMENVEKSSNNWQFEMTQSNVTAQYGIGLAGVSSEQIVTNGNHVNIEHNKVNTRNNPVVLQRQNRRSSKRRTVTKRRVKNESRRFESVHSNTRITARRENNARREHRRSTRSNLTVIRQKTRRFIHRSNDATDRISVRVKLVDNKRNSVSDSSRINTGSEIRNKRLKHRDRSTRGIRRIARTTELRNSRSRRSTVYRSVPGNDQIKELINNSEHVTSHSVYLHRETPNQTRSRRNSVSGRRRREFRSRHGRRGLEDKIISQYEHNDSYTNRNSIDVPATNYATRNSRGVVRRMTGSRRDTRTFRQTQKFAITLTKGLDSNNEILPSSTSRHNQRWWCNC
ncbi:uncharacterized protein LOC117328173 [Pecten maximus]|uniref:uncharacterized protein LOC117328173 n=1 Tax=Pecten maximus TaxID=6579 RepID=UPI001457EDF1|nr:uncharacterized protein LOC117328173 [Pecten maximus]